MLFLFEVEVHREAFRDVFENFGGVENFIKLQIEETCNGKKISVEEVFYFYILLVF